MEQDLDQQNIGLKLKWLREKRKLSLRALGLKSGIAASHISNIEAGISSPTVNALQKILSAMKMDVFEFFSISSKDYSSEKVIFPKSEMAVVKDEDRTYYYAFPKSSDISMQLTYEEHLPHTQILEKDSYKGDICGIVISGELTVDMESGKYKAGRGDAFYLKSGKVHAGRNESDEPLLIVAVQQL